MSKAMQTATMTHWSSCALPPIRPESHFGDRVVNCFGDRAQSLDRLFERACRLYPHREALVHDAHRISYQDLRRLVMRSARRFQAIGIKAGDRVVMQIANRIEFVVIMLALQRIAAIAVPVSIREQASGLIYIIHQCEASAVLIDDCLSQVIETFAIILPTSQRCMPYRLYMVSTMPLARTFVFTLISTLML